MVWVSRGFEQLLRHPGAALPKRARSPAVSASAVLSPSLLGWLLGSAPLAKLSHVNHLLSWVLQDYPVGLLFFDGLFAFNRNEVFDRNVNEIFNRKWSIYALKLSNGKLCQQSEPQPQSQKAQGSHSPAAAGPAASCWFAKCGRGVLASWLGFIDNIIKYITSSGFLPSTHPSYYLQRTGELLTSRGSTSLPRTEQGAPACT